MASLCSGSPPGKKHPPHLPVSTHFYLSSSPANVVEAPQVPSTSRWLQAMLRAMCSSSPRCRPQKDPKPWVPNPGPGPSVQPATLHHPPIALSLPHCAVGHAKQTPLFRSLFNDPCLLSLPDGPDFMKPGGLLPITCHLF